jgi:hypothetical protein
MRDFLNATRLTCKKSVKRHKGHIVCFSQPGAGTTFSIYFPALISDMEVEDLIASGYTANGSVKHTVANGAKRFINKPYAVRQVLETVRAVLDSE